MKFIFAIILNLFLAFGLGSAVGYASGSEVLGHLTTLVSASTALIPMQRAVLRMASSVDLSEILSEYGSYYIDGGQNMKNLINRIYEKTRTTSLARSMITKNTQERFSAPKISSLVQPFQNSFTSKGNAEFKPKTFDLFRMKIDWEEHPDEFVASWLGFLTDEKKTRKDWPFVKYLIENLIIKQAKEDMELSEYFYGEYAAPTEGTAGATGTSMDGLKKTVDDGIGAGDINEVTGLSAITDSNAVDQIEEFAGTVEDGLKGEPFVIMTSKGITRSYHKDYRNTFGANPTYVKEDLDLDFVNGKLAPVASMTGSDYLIATPAWNLVHLRRAKTEIPFEVEVQKRQLSVYTDWFECLGFLVDEYVYAYAPGWSQSGS